MWELLASLRIEHAKVKHRAMDGLLHALRENEESVLSALGCGNVAGLVQLLTHGDGAQGQGEGGDCALLARRVRHSGARRDVWEKRGYNCHFLLLRN